MVNIGRTIDIFASPAASALRVLGLARKAMPNALTKQAATKAAVIAKVTNSKIPATLPASPGQACGRKNKACSVIHSLINPLSGGKAAIATEPTKKAVAVYGMR